jgi:hypothetical protein
MFVSAEEHLCTVLQFSQKIIMGSHCATAAVTCNGRSQHVAVMPLRQLIHALYEEMCHSSHSLMFAAIAVLFIYWDMQTAVVLVKYV